MSKAITDHAARASRIEAAVPADDQKARASNYYLGIDGGGTKTHAIITDDSYRVLGEGFSGASNPLRVGLDRAVAHIEAATQEACHQAGIKLHQITSGCVGLAGISHQIHYHTMKDALEHTLRIENLQLTTDAQAALEGALDGQPGIVLIAGTGSIALGKNSSGEQARAGGWGPTFGDEGSGYDIARRALKAVASSFDGRSPKTLLTELVTRTLRISSTADLPGVIYNSDMESSGQEDKMITYTDFVGTIGKAAGVWDQMIAEGFYDLDETIAQGYGPIVEEGRALELLGRFWASNEGMIHL